MYRSRYNKPIIGTLPLLILTVVMMAFMLLPVFLGTGDAWVRTMSVVFPLLCAVAVSLSDSSLSIIKKNFILPAYFFLITYGSLDFSTGLWRGYVCTAILLYAWFQCTRMQKTSNDTWGVFNMMFALGIGTLISWQMIVFIPLMIMGFSFYDKLSLRNLTASFLAIGCVYALLYSISYLAGYIDVVNDYVSSLYFFSDPIELRNADALIYGIISIYTLIAFIAFASKYNSNSIAFRRTMLLGYLLLFTATLLNMLTGTKEIGEPMISMLLGLVLPQYVETNQSKTGKIAFYTLLCVLIITFVFKNFLL